MKACRYFFVLILLFGASNIRAAENVQSVPASDFLNSLGMCTHIGQGADDPQKSATALAFAGIRNIRDDASARHVPDWIAVHQQAGIKVVLTMGKKRGHSYFLWNKIRNVPFFHAELTKFHEAMKKL